MISVNDIDCLGTITIPARGAWTADLVIAGPVDAPSVGSAADVRLYDRKLSGIVIASNSAAEGHSKTVRVQPWPSRKDACRAQMFRSTSSKNIARHILGADIGDCNVTSFDSYTITTSSKQSSLARLCDRIGASWWARDDGKIDIGTRAATYDESKLTRIDGDGSNGLHKFELDAYSAGLQPCGTIGGIAIESIYIDCMSDDSASVTACSSPGLPRWLASIKSDIDHSFLLSSLQVMVIDSQNADYTLNLRGIGAIPDLQSVPVEWGIPGAKCKVSSGHALVSFGGDAATPRAIAWDSNAVTEVIFDAQLMKWGGDAATQSVLCGESTLSKINEKLTLILNHEHPVSGALAGPSNTLKSMLPIDSSVLSTKVKVAP